MTKSRVLSAAYALVLLGTWMRLDGVDLNTCLQPRLQAPPEVKGASGDTLELSLFNNCGKDITAYKFVILDSSGEITLGTAIEELAKLAFPQPKPAWSDVFRVNTALRLPTAAPPPGGSLSVVAVIFIDGSSTGDAKEISTLLDFRQESLGDRKYRLTILDSVADWNDALELRRRANQAEPKGSASAFYLERLAKRQERSNATSWSAFVTDERQQLLKVIEIFESHLQKTGDGQS